MTKFTNASTCSPFNSTQFTDCCGVAVLPNDTECDRCGATILLRQRAPGYFGGPNPEDYSARIGGTA